MLARWTLVIGILSTASLLLGPLLSGVRVLRAVYQLVYINESQLFVDSKRITENYIDSPSGELL